MQQNEFIRIRAIIRGRVQGVGFRRFVYRQAQSMAIGGWVRNNPEGSVELEAVGEASAIEIFMREIKKGPFLSRVDEVEQIQKEPLAHHPKVLFIIR
ncbi:MAG: acylphosphatase [Erysipelotrichia bacterium]|nr:acylphosphatase [Erysipelotrichia bacterium]